MLETTNHKIFVVPSFETQVELKYIVCVKDEFIFSIQFKENFVYLHVEAGKLVEKCLLEARGYISLFVSTYIRGGVL